MCGCVEFPIATLIFVESDRGDDSGKSCRTRQGFLCGLTWLYEVETEHFFRFLHPFFCASWKWTDFWCRAQSHGEQTLRKSPCLRRLIPGCANFQSLAAFFLFFSFLKKGLSEWFSFISVRFHMRDLIETNKMRYRSEFNVGRTKQWVTRPPLTPDSAFRAHIIFQVMWHLSPKSILLAIDFPIDALNASFVWTIRFASKSFIAYITSLPPISRYVYILKKNSWNLYLAHFLMTLYIEVHYALNIEE